MAIIKPVTVAELAAPTLNKARLTIEALTKENEASERAIAILRSQREDLRTENAALKAEVERLKDESVPASNHKALWSLHDAWKARAERAEATLARFAPLIEAAGKVDKELAIKTLRRLYHPMFQEKGRPVSVPIFDTIMPILEALPDEVKP